MKHLVKDIIMMSLKKPQEDLFSIIIFVSTEENQMRSGR